MKKFFLVSLVFLLLLPLFLPKALLAKTTLILATGEPQGTYFALGQGLKSVIEKEDPNLEILVLRTNGSIENAKLMEVGSVHLALIQNDIAYNFTNGKRMFTFPSNKMKGIASLYTEIIQIVAGKELNIKKIPDLKNKTINLGPESSGTAFNATVILKSAEITYEDIKAEFLSVNDAVDSLFTKKTDVVFITAGIPTPSVKKIADKINFVPITSSEIQQIRTTYPYFISTSIPAKTYETQYKAVPALGLRALLVAREDIKPEIIELISQAILTNTKALKSFHPAASSIQLKTVMKGMSIPLHPGARNYYMRRKVIKQSIMDAFLKILPFIILALFILAGIKYKRFMRQILDSNLYLKIFVIFCGFFTTGTIGMYLFEKGVNENFSNLFEAFWSAVVYLISGFEDRDPITVGGKFMSIFIFIASIGILGSVAGNFAYIFLKKEEIKMPGNINQHIVICNWNKKGEKIIKELYNSKALLNTGIIVLLDKRPGNEKELRKNNSHEYSNVEFRECNLLRSESLEGANILKAKGVILLADENNQQPDTKSALIALSINSLWARKIKDETKQTEKQEEGRGESLRNYNKPYVVAEAIDYQMIEHLKNSGVEEIICSEDYGTGLLAQCILNKRIVTVYHDLLTYTKWTNEIYIIQDKEISKAVTGKKFTEIAEFINNNRDPDNPAILLGLKRGDGIILNPKENGVAVKEKKLPKFERFKEKDALIVMAFEYPKYLNKLICSMSS